MKSSAIAVAVLVRILVKIQILVKCVKHHVNQDVDVKRIIIVMKMEVAFILKSVQSIVRSDIFLNELF
jgi:hypothetical protein